MQKGNAHPVVQAAHAVYTTAQHPHTLIVLTLLTALLFLLASPLLLTLPQNALLSALTEQLVVSEINPRRASVGVGSLSVHPKLSSAAQAKAQDMLARDYFSHYGPEGEEPWTWIKNAGYTYSGAGENLAIDFSDASALVQAWINSPSHRKNIENGLFTDIGIGIATGEYQGRTTSVVVMFVGREYTPALATTTPEPEPAPEPAPEPQPEPEPAPEPEPEPEPTPEPAPEPEPTPTPEPQPEPEPEPAPEPAPEPEPEPEPEPRPEPEPDEPFIVITDTMPTDTNGAPPPAAPKRSVQQSTVAYLLNGANVLRIILSAFLATAMLAWLVLMTMPKHHVRLHPMPSAFHVLLLALLWVPTIL